MSCFIFPAIVSVTVFPVLKGVGVKRLAMLIINKCVLSCRPSTILCVYIANNFPVFPHLVCKDACVCVCVCMRASQCTFSDFMPLNNYQTMRVQDEQPNKQNWKVKLKKKNNTNSYIPLHKMRAYKFN